MRITARSQRPYPIDNSKKRGWKIGRAARRLGGRGSGRFDMSLIGTSRIEPGHIPAPGGYTGTGQGRGQSPRGGEATAGLGAGFVRMLRSAAVGGVQAEVDVRGLLCQPVHG